MINVFHTVPIHNNIMTRNLDNKKVDGLGEPIRFYKDWTKYQNIKNTIDTPLLAAIAGKDFIGIDIDNNLLFNKAIAILDNYKIGYRANSLPMEANKGGHLLFKFSVSVREELLLIRKYLKKYNNIDIQLDNSLIYLATEANKTKELVTPKLNSLDDLTPLPLNLLAWLKSLVTDILLMEKQDTKVIKQDTYTTDYYGYITAKLDPAIVKRLTPKKDFGEVTNMNDIPYGMGTEWLLQVRKKLMLDTSVSKDDFTKTIIYLNSLWKDPMPISKVKADINRDINNPEFIYDPNWKRSGFMFTTPHKHTIEVLYNLNNSYILFNRTTQEITKYPNFSSVSDVILAITKKRYTKDILLPKSIAVYEVNDPMKVPFIEKDEYNRDIFNIFKPSEGLRIIRDIDTLENPRRPDLILWFFEHLIPDKGTRDKFLGYLSYKYSTYDYSPLYFVMAGAVGAGKGILVHEILPYLSSPDRMYSVQYEEFMGKFNSYLANLDWLEIDEGGEGFTVKEGEKLVAQLKRLTGSAYTTIINKGVDSSASNTTRHYITPIISTNLNTKLITDSVANDRRMVFIRSPDKLEPKLPITINGTTIVDTREFIQLLTKELPHFAYYLKSVKRITPQDYLSNSNWKTKDYENYIESTLTNSEKLYNKACIKDTQGFVDVLLDAGVDTLLIDNLFKLSVDTKPAFIILYNTTRTKELGVKSLEELMLEIPTIGGDARKMFKVIKNVRGYREDYKGYKLNVIEFNSPYIKQSYLVDDCDLVELGE